MFESADTTRIVTSPAVLRESFVPEDAVHRESELNGLSHVLSPVTRGEPAPPVVLTGPSGVGKTTIARFVLDRLQETVGAQTAHVNCWEAHTAFKSLYEVLRAVGRGVDVHRRSTPRDELLDRLAAIEPHLVVTLDEVDQLADGSLLYDLYQSPGVSILLVTNDEQELLQGMDSRIRSRLQTAETIQFDAYRSGELVDILTARVEHGLAPETVTTTQLRTIAEAAGGDARVAIAVLRNAAREAEREGSDRLTDTHVQTAIPEGRQAVRTRALDALRPQQQVLYELLTEAGEIPPGELYELYAERVAEPRTKRTVRSWLQKLTHYDLVVASGNGPGRTYRAVSPDT